MRGVAATGVMPAAAHADCELFACVQVIFLNLLPAKPFLAFLLSSLPGEKVLEAELS
jgi:hypothetical protein